MAEHIIFRGGPDDGQTLDLSPLEPSGIPMSEFKLMNRARFAGGVIEDYDTFYRYTGEQVGEGYVYEFVSRETIAPQHVEPLPPLDFRLA